MVRIGLPAETSLPMAACTVETRPAQGAFTSCLAFIASTAATTWPSVTVSPTLTLISTNSTLPSNGEKTSVVWLPPFAGAGAWPGAGAVVDAGGSMMTS